MSVDEIMDLAAEYRTDEFGAEQKLRAAITTLVAERDAMKEADQAHRQAQAAIYLALAPVDPDRSAWPGAIAALRVDAERYAFAKTLTGQVITMEIFKHHGAEALDAAIDAAMKDKT